MEFFNVPLLLHLHDYSLRLLPRVCVVVVAAFVCIRWQWVRRALRGAETAWPQRLVMMLAFGGLGILGTHSSQPVNVGQTVSFADWPVGVLLTENQALVGFRDTLVMVGGLVGGPWVGLGAGLLAGAERYGLGGFAAESSGFATVVLGLVAGWARRRRPRGAMTAQGAFIVALFGTALHRSILLVLAQSSERAGVLGWDIFLPVALVNCLGCVLFVWVLRDLDRDKLAVELRLAQWREQQARQREQALELLKQQAELRSLRAQVEPHFLNNTLSAIRSLIRLDPAKARDYVYELAKFFEATRKSASASFIPLNEELAQLERYMGFQQLRFKDKYHYRAIDIPPRLLNCPLPPHSLLTLVENALVHGFCERAEGFWLRVSAEDFGDCYRLILTDNGKGIAPALLSKLGKEPVESDISNGTALHQLSRSLDLGFAGRASLAITSEWGSGTEVVLTLPKEQ